jgi:hypothetical protein
VKKSQIIVLTIVGLIIFLVITNPNLKQFKEDINYVPDVDTECPSFVDPHFLVYKKWNLFICGFYSYYGSKYLAIAGNVFLLSSTPLKHTLVSNGCTIYTDKVEDATN